MADRHRGGFRTRVVTRRGTFWGRSPSASGTTALAATTAVLDSTAVPVVEGETIVRTRGMIHIASDQQSAVENVVGAVGMLVASNPAVAVGVGSLPTPDTDSDSDLWFMHQYFADRSAVDGAGLDWTNGFKTFPFDSKAMRKMEDGQTLCVIVENSSITGMLYILQYAVLFKVR